MLSIQTVMLASGTAIGYGSTLTMTDTSNKIKKGTKGDVSVLNPTLIISVPAILDRIRDAVFKKVSLFPEFYFSCRSMLVVCKRFFLKKGCQVHRLVICVT